MQGVQPFLEHMGLDPMYIEVNNALYASPQLTVRRGGKVNRTCLASSGIRQGCSLSPYLFLFVHIAIIDDEDAKVEREEGRKPWIRSAEVPLTQLVYADYTLVVSSTVHGDHTAPHTTHGGTVPPEA